MTITSGRINSNEMNKIQKKEKISNLLCEIQIHSVQRTVEMRSMRARLQISLMRDNYWINSSNETNERADKMIVMLCYWFFFSFSFSWHMFCALGHRSVAREGEFIYFKMRMSWHSEFRWNWNLSSLRFDHHVNYGVVLITIPAEYDVLVITTCERIVQPRLYMNA